MDDLKIMKQLAEMERMHVNFENFVRDKRSHFDNVAQILNDSRFMTAPFSDNVTIF